MNKLRNTNIERVSTIKLLGITINEHLSWKDHIVSLIKKLRQTYCVTLRIKSYLNESALLTIYHSLFVSHLRCCISNWCFGNVTLIAKLQHLSDKFVRIIFNLSHKEDVSNVMKANNLLTIKNLYKTEISMLMFKYHKQLLPSAFDNLFTLKRFVLKPEVIVK